MKKFVNYLAPLGALPDMAESVDAFVTGLEPALQAEVVNARNLALKFAQAELGIPEPRGVESQPTKNPMGSDKGNQRKNEFHMKQITIPIKENYPKGELPVKRLSDAKFRACLDKGLCFRCNEKGKGIIM